jgi:hypothetical protein
MRRLHARKREGARVGAPAPCAQTESRKAGEASREPLGCGTPRFLKALSFRFRHERPTPLGSISDYNGGPCKKRLRIRNLGPDRGSERARKRPPRLWGLIERGRTVALEQCVECGGQVATSAMKCPHCGAVDPSPSGRIQRRRNGCGLMVGLHAYERNPARTEHSDRINLAGLAGVYCLECAEREFDEMSA